MDFLPGSGLATAIVRAGGGFGVADGFAGACFTGGAFAATILAGGTAFFATGFRDGFALAAGLAALVAATFDGALFLSAGFGLPDFAFAFLLIVRLPRGRVRFALKARLWAPPSTEGGLWAPLNTPSDSTLRPGRPAM